MAGFLDQFRAKVITSVFKDQQEPPKPQELNDKIALGVLLWIVAQADEEFLPEEMEKIKEILKSYGQIQEQDMPCILESIRQAADQRIDLYHFTHEVREDLPYASKVAIVENLFRVACADQDLDHSEHEIIRKISNLLGVEHKEFIDSKLKIKKEFNLPTA